MLARHSIFGNIEFVVFATEMQAASEVMRAPWAGDKLRAARSRAGQVGYSRHRDDGAAGRSYFATGEYETARALLEEVRRLRPGRTIWKWRSPWRSPVRLVTSRQHRRTCSVSGGHRPAVSRSLAPAAAWPSAS